MSPEPQWAKFCAKEPNTGRDACATMRDFSTSADQPPLISINVFELAGEERRKLRLLMQPIGMLLRPGFRVIIDKGEPIDGKYDMCFPNACSAEIEISAKTLETLKKGQTMSVVMRVPGGDASGRELTFNIPLKDLGPAFDGKPTDPKVLEQQRQELQQQLQKRAEEQRKLLEQQNGARRPGRERGSGCAGCSRRSGCAAPPAAPRRSGEVTRLITPPARKGGVARATSGSIAAEEWRTRFGFDQAGSDGARRNVFSSVAICRGRSIFRPPSARKLRSPAGGEPALRTSSDTRFCSETYATYWLSAFSA